MLRRLTKLDVIELRAEADKLDAEFAELTALVSDPDARRKVIDRELVETAKLFKGAEFGFRDWRQGGGRVGADLP